MSRQTTVQDGCTMPLQFRALTDAAMAVDVDARTAELSFSSEAGYERVFGVEVLDHQQGSVRMGRLAGGAALLLNHDPNQQVGVVERAWLDNGKGRAIVRFSRSAMGQEVLQDVRDGIRSLVSVGYAIHEMEMVNGRADGPATYRVTDWEPYEISIVSIPADASVGIGRSAVPEFPARVRGQVSPPPQGKQKESIMQIEVNAPAGETAAMAPQLSAENARRMEQARAAALAKLGESNQIDHKVVRGWIESDRTLDEAAQEVLGILSERAKKDELLGHLDMGAEANRYSLLRALRCVVDKNWSKGGLELRAHEEIQKRLGRAPRSDNSFYVPLDVLRRDLTVGTGNAGGYLVQTSNVGFVDLLRNQTALMSMGMTRLGGLVDNITIPRQTAGATAYWLATEATSITESQMTLGQISMTPKSVGAYTEISRLLTLQSSPDVESMVMRDLAAQVAIDVDAKGLNGSGASGQPTGLLNTSGVGSVTGTSIAYAGIIEFMTDVFGANALQNNCGFLTTGTVAGLLKQRVKFTNTASPMWEGQLQAGAVDGYRAMASNQVPAGTLVFGDWSQMVMAEWGVLEVDVNPYANFAAGIIGVRAMYSVDFAVRVPGAFSVATSVT